MLKRKRDTDLPRAKRLHAASVSLLRRDWVQKEVLAKDGVARNADGTFSLTMRKDCILTRAQVDEIVKAVNTDTEVAYVRFHVCEGRLVVSVENEYPAKAAMRREERKKEGDSWWRHLDVHEKKGEDVTADCVWSNELAAVPEYDRRCLLTVQPLAADKARFAIHIVRPLTAVRT